MIYFIIINFLLHIYLRLFSTYIFSYLSHILFFLPTRNIATNKLLFELISYFVFQAQLFCFKVFAINYIKLIQIYIIIYKLILYYK